MKYKIIQIIVVFLLLSGCARTVSYMRYTDDNYPPTKNVEVLRAKPISKKFIELGELKLRVSRSNENSAVISLKAKAKSIGADAIVMLGETSGGSVAVPINTMQGTMYSVVNKRYITALAIKYKP